MWHMPNYISFKSMFLDNLIIAKKGLQLEKRRKEKMKLLGKQLVSYTSKKTNNLVEGLTLHCSTTANNVEGTAVETIFVSKKSAMYDAVVQMPLNCEIVCSYNRWGNVETVQQLK